MSIHVTEIGKHKFVCGLFWQSLSRPRELMSEARELGRKIDSDLMVLRKDNTMAQAGYAHSKEGARRGMFSLAAIVSKTLAIEGAHYDGRKQVVHNWLAAFRLPDGSWAYFAARDANFLPNGDFAGTKEEVLDRLHGDYGLGGWNVVIGDPELAEHGFHNFTAMRIEDLIPRRKNGQIRVHNWWSLVQIERRIPWKTLIAAGAVATLLCGGFVYWNHARNVREQAELARTLEAARRLATQDEAPIPMPHPWPGKPAPEDLAKACMERLKFLTPGGWTLDEYACTATAASYLWSRNESTVDQLVREVPEAHVEVSGNKAGYSEIFGLPTGKDEALLKTSDVLRPVLSRLQMLGVSARITNMPPPPAPQGKKFAPPDWQTYSISFNADAMTPADIATVLALPGVRVNKFAYRDGAWSVEGEIYAN
jgi:hypothetical protein